MTDLFGGALPDPEVVSTAELSPCGTYRYRLTRTWDAARPSMTFIMLNPSTADAAKDDPTIRRCVGFAKREQCGGLVVVNLYAYRATNPVDLWAVADPVGPDNDAHIARAVSGGGLVVAAWGANAKPGRAAVVAHVPLLSLGVTKAGHPRHPLYVPGATPLTTYRGTPEVTA